MFCPNCGKEVGDDDRYCTTCAYRLVPNDGAGSPVDDIHAEPEPAYVRVDTKSTGWALFMTLLLPGIGALYVDGEMKGLVVFLASVVAALLAGYVTFIVGVLLMFGLWIYGIFITSHAIDSYKMKNNIR